jgi:hypothetical protein
MKDKEIRFGFVAGQGAWKKTIWLNPQKAGYDPTIWKAAGWFFYPYSMFKEKSDMTKKYTGTFQVVETETNSVLGEKSVEFFIKNDNR